MRFERYGLLRRFSFVLPAALSALAAHAAAYRSLLPETGVHGYFGGYEAVIAVLSVGASALLAGLLLAALLNRAAAGRAPFRLESRSTRTATLWVAPAALVLLLMQESIERSLGQRGLALASFSAAQWLALVGTIALAAAVFGLLGRGYRTLSARLSGYPPLRSRRPDPRRTRPFARPTHRPRSPLATGRALRAPPLSAS